MTAFDTLKSIEYGSFSPSLAFAGIDVVNTDYSYAAGKAVMYHYRLKLSGDDGRWSFPALFCRPKGNGPFPAVVNIGFERNVPNKYLPLGSGLGLRPVCSILSGALRIVHSPHTLFSAIPDSARPRFLQVRKIPVSPV